MSGQWLTIKQVEIYMSSRKEGNTQVVSSAKAGISERSGRDIDHGTRDDPHTKPRPWRTRIDPLKKVWIEELVPMLEKKPSLKPLTLLEHIQSTYGEIEYPDSILRTIQRRVKEWCHLSGPEHEVMFRQNHRPGHQGLSDFTEFTDIEITIKGKILTHKLYHFRLAFSGWSYMQVIIGGESYAALSDGLQNALWLLGGSPSEHRTDSLSASFKNLSVLAKDDQTEQYNLLCEHLNMTATRNNRGVSHENGSIESPHGHLKRRIKQALLLRDSYDFDSIEAYQKWLEAVVRSHNKRNAKKVIEELASLQPLPSLKAANYSVISAKVSTSSTIQVTTSLYSVPSSLIGSFIQVHQYHDHLECYLGSKFIIRLERVFGQGKKRRAKCIDYTHVIDSLIKKPGAFYNYQHREALFPNDIYRAVWLSLDELLEPIEASKLMIGVLYLAAKQDCELSLGELVLSMLNKSEIPCLTALNNRYGLETNKTCPVIELKQHELIPYDQLIPSQEESHHELC